MTATQDQRSRQSPASRPRKGWSGQSIFLAAVLAASTALVGYLVLADAAERPRGNSSQQKQAEAKLTPSIRQQLAAIPFDGAQAYAYLKEICDLGPRVSGTPAMAAQQKLIIDHFEKLGAKVIKQEFQARHPLTAQPVTMTNLIVQWHPDRKERVLLCAHYDTRPYPDRDPVNPYGVFIGANDGASGVALLMELGKMMPKFESQYGVDLLLVDGEELVYFDRGMRSRFDPGDPYCLGSEYFARNYVADPPPYKYRWGVVLDMVGGANLQLLQERQSVEWADTKPLVDKIWGIAAKLGVKEFIRRTYPDPITDDHVPLHNIAGIPTCDIIDMHYRFWHTQSDVPAQCSPLSLAKVGWVVQEWLKGL